MYELCLAHHGIKGMKWGVRRYQNPDGTLTAAGKKKYLKNTTGAEIKSIRKDDIIIKRGSVRSHVSGNKRIKLDDTETYLYDANNDHDRAVYEGAFAEYVRQGRRCAKQYVHDYVVTEDLISPSEKQRVNTFLESYKKNPEKYYPEMNDTVSNLKMYQDYGYELAGRNKKIAGYKKEFSKKTSDKELRDYGYHVLNVIAENGSRHSQAINDYYKNVKNKGYNALVDDNNRKVYNDAVQPIIALNGQKALKEIGRYRLSDTERNNNIEALRDYNEKQYGTRTVAL